jgi:LPXTG-motif cell wall-anchored protein
MIRKKLKVLSGALIFGNLVLLLAANVGATESIMPLSEFPVTGDNTNLFPLILIAVVAAAAMVLLLITRKKK